MTTSSSEIRRWIVDAIRDESVAVEAAVAYGTWSNEIDSRVFVGTAGFLGSRNRGRLPFFDVITSSQTFADETGQGGTIRTTIRLHDTGRDIEATTDRMTATMTAAIASIRDNRNNNYTQLGDDTIEDLQPGPMGWKLEAAMNFQHSYDRETYEIL